ncbi:hypothetical protein Nmel_003201, partial [Mimus melanotis]
MLLSVVELWNGLGWKGPHLVPILCHGLGTMSLLSFALPP